MKCRNDDSGVSNVVSLIMIAGIVISLLGMIFATYLPAWGKDNEAQTLESTMGSFMDLKSGMDTLAVGGDEGTSLTTSIALGSEGGPMFGFGRMTGSIRVDSAAGKMQVTDGTGTNMGQSRGVVSYRSNNVNVDDQEITLEGGALLRDQAGASVLKGHPNLLINRYQNTGETVMFIHMPTVEGSGQSFAGTSTYLISTTLVSVETTEYTMGTGTETIFRITSEHFNIWNTHIRSMVLGEGLVESDGVSDNDFSTATGVDIDGNDYFELTLYDLDKVQIKTSVFQVNIN